MKLILKDGSEFSVVLIQAYVIPGNDIDSNQNLVLFINPGVNPDETLTNVLDSFTATNISECNLFDDGNLICSFSFIELVKATNFTDTMTKNISCEVVLKYQ